MIENQRLKLIPCELSHFEAILGNQKELESILDITVPAKWTEFPEAIPYAYEYLKANPSTFGWGTYLFIHKQDKMLIGWGGFKGKANELGIVEIGYEIIPDYRNRGLATEAAQGLINYAFSHPYINSVEAHTLAEANASTKVLEKGGMTFVGTMSDSEDGEVWHWRLSREEYNTWGIGDFQS